MAIFLCHMLKITPVYSSGPWALSAIWKRSMFFLGFQSQVIALLQSVLFYAWGECHHTTFNVLVPTQVNLTEAYCYFWSSLLYLSVWPKFAHTIFLRIGDLGHYQRPPVAYIPICILHCYHKSAFLLSRFVDNLQPGQSDNSIFSAKCPHSMIIRVTSGQCYF